MKNIFTVFGLTLALAMAAFSQTNTNNASVLQHSIVIPATAGVSTYVILFTNSEQLRPLDLNGHMIMHPRGMDIMSYKFPVVTTVYSNTWVDIVYNGKTNSHLIEANIATKITNFYAYKKILVN